MSCAPPCATPCATPCACAAIALVPGDTLDLLIHLYTAADGNRLPLQMVPGEAFVLTLGREVATTAAIGPSRLQVAVGADRTTLARQFTPAETGPFRNAGSPCGPPLDWSLVRIPAQGIRRTYARGPIAVAAHGCGGAPLQRLDLTVTEGGTVIQPGGVPDVASYADAREAALRQDLALRFAEAETRAAAYALLL